MPTRSRRRPPAGSSRSGRPADPCCPLPGRRGWSRCAWAGAYGIALSTAFALLLPTGTAVEGEDMVVSGTMLARELRRRRAGRRAMVASLNRADRSTWVPGDVRTAPTELLVLAALALTRPYGRPAPTRSLR